MKNRSIVFKLFSLTTIFFLLFLVLVMAGQSLFFERFYVERKVGRVQKDLEEFAKRYSQSSWSKEQIGENTKQFVENNNAQIAILDQYGMLKYMNSYEITLKTDDGKLITIPLNNIALSDGLEKLDLQVGTKAAVEGLFFDSQNRMAGISSIEANNHMWKNGNSIITANAAGRTPNVSTIALEPVGKGYDITFFPEEDKLRVAVPKSEAIQVFSAKAEAIAIMNRKIVGTITKLDMPSKLDFLLPYRTNMLLNAVDNWFWLSQNDNIKLQPNKIVRYQYTDPSNGVKSEIFVMPLFNNGVLNEVLFSMSSLQPVDEAVEAMRDYYIYGFAAAVIFILLLSLTYSRMIARPLININKVALKMSEMDFAEQLEVASNDEIGSLSYSINTLSRNLKEKIEQLHHANEQLTQDIEKERRLELMRKEFISGVSHELKTPLSIIKSYTEGIKDGISKDKADYYLDVIMDESVKMEGLVRDMLDLSKLESHNVSLDLESFSISEMVHQVAGKLSCLSMEKDIAVYLPDIGENLYVTADKRRIEQVLRNLFSNALLYTQKNGIVDVRLSYSESRVKIMIENYGEHIPEDKLDKIWDRFYRLDESRDRKTGGTGLGLSIVKNILQLHQSQFGVCNTDYGVLFFFDLDITNAFDSR